MSADKGSDHLAIAQAWTDAITDGDRDGIEKLVAEDFVMWRNVTRATQERSEFINLAARLSSVLPGFRYTDVKRIATDDGFVQQHIVTGQGPSGQTFEAPACIICQVQDGRISKMDEYYDSAHDPR